LARRALPRAVEARRAVVFFFPDDRDGDFERELRVDLLMASPEGGQTD
jgi:hypothetical protein